MPPALKPGDCIGLISPAGPVRDPDRVAAGIRLLEDMGFRVKSFRQPGSNNEYLAATDQERVNELHRLWADDEVHALMAIRGGYGCLRMVQSLDMDLPAMTPKMLIGFSDITVLLNAVCQQAAIMTIHGPVVSSLVRSDHESRQAFFSLLTGHLTEYHLSGRLETIKDGTARGILRGGNLTTLVHMIGTPWEIPWQNSLLVLEDTGEAMYRLDRMLTQLYHGGKLQRLAGLILGTFDTRIDEDRAEIRLHEQLFNRVLELTTEFDYPVWGKFPIGHGQQNTSLPLGMEATMDSAAGRLRLHPESSGALI